MKAGKIVLGGGCVADDDDAGSVLGSPSLFVRAAFRNSFRVGSFAGRGPPVEER